MKHILDKSIEAAPSHEKGLEEKRMEQLSVNEQVTKAYLTNTWELSWDPKKVTALNLRASSYLLPST